MSRAHLPLRPLWLCRVCAAPWPCATARLTLLREYADARVTLLIYLATLLHEAVDDLYALNPDDGPTPEQLFARFIGWARPRRHGRCTDRTLDESRFRSDLDAAIDQGLPDREW